MPADDTVGGIRASAASFVLRAKHRLRRRRHKRRASALVYAASAFMHHSLLSGLPPLICPETQKSAGSMVLRNQQTDALNFVKLFYEKSPLLRGNSSYKRGLHPIISPESRKRGVQITLNASQTALTSMLETVKIGVWETPERLDAMRFSPHGI